MDDYIVCIYTSENDDILYVMEENNINNIISINTITELLQLRFIDILFVCDDKSTTLYKYMDFIKTKYKNIKIVCVVKKDDYILSNKLIEHGCDCIIRRDDKCSVLAKTIVDRIKDFIKLYNKNKKFKQIYDRRKIHIKGRLYRRRKDDYMMVNNYG